MIVVLGMLVVSSDSCILFSWCVQRCVAVSVRGAGVIGMWWMMVVAGGGVWLCTDVLKIVCVCI